MVSPDNTRNLHNYEYFVGFTSKPWTRYFLVRVGVVIITFLDIVPDLVFISVFRRRHKN